MTGYLKAGLALPMAATQAETSSMVYSRSAKGRARCDAVSPSLDVPRRLPSASAMLCAMRQAKSHMPVTILLKMADRCDRIADALERRLHARRCDRMAGPDAPRDGALVEKEG